MFTGSASVSAQQATKMSPSWCYWLIYILPVAVYVGIALGGAWTLLTVALVFIGIVLADALLGLDLHNPDPVHEVERRASPRFQYPLLVWLPMQVMTLLITAWAVTAGWLSTLEIIGLTLSVGVMSGGGGITIAHELVHRKEQRYAQMGWVLMITVLYGHWAIEHVRGHHFRVATPEDPATSRLGETVYAFVPRSIIGGFKSAWQLEARRMARRNRPLWSWQNQVIRGCVYQSALLGAVALLFGPLGLAFWLGQALIGVCLLEVVNYLEHYGLLRQQQGEQYERVRPIHSWNAAHRVTNWVLFALGRHSDHHAAAAREYPILRHMADAPQLPAGYPAMVLAALFPPLWFRVMNPRVEEWRARHFSSEPLSI